MEGKAEEFGFTNKETSHGGTCLLFQLKQSGPKSLSNDIKIKGGAGKGWTVKYPGPFELGMLPELPRASRRSSGPVSRSKAAELRKAS